MSFFQRSPSDIQHGFRALYSYLSDEDAFRYCVRRLCVLLRYRKRGKRYHDAIDVVRVVRRFESRQRLPRFLSVLPVQEFIRQLEDLQMLCLPVRDQFKLAVRLAPSDSMFHQEGDYEKVSI